MMIDSSDVPIIMFVRVRGLVLRLDVMYEKTCFVRLLKNEFLGKKNGKKPVLFG